MIEQQVWTVGCIEKNTCYYLDVRADSSESAQSHVEEQRPEAQVIHVTDANYTAPTDVPQTIRMYEG